MRGGLERWKRGIESQGVRQAMAYAFRGTCDSHLRLVAGVEALVAYGSGASPTVTRFVVEDGAVTVDELDGTQLRRWVDGRDPAIGEMRGRVLLSPDADLILDGTINAPKSFSVAAVLDPELAAEFEELQDRLRTRIIQTWQRELNARRGSGGRIRESLCRVEVVELRHRRSRALDPHIHRHLWLNVKVQGRDGKWSNVDSRVAMKLHTLINAEGDLAARTDPVWVAALARHGYTLNADGEIAELVAAVKPLSRRSNQIEANRVRLLHQWRDSHPGQEPDHAVLQQVDRWAWASGRPGKPEDLDETEWEQVVRGEIRRVDRSLLVPRAPVPVAAVRVGELDRDLLAARAIVDADARSTGSGGRFSSVDLRACATRAVASSGVVAERDMLQELIEDVTDRAQAMTVDLLAAEGPRPGHVKGYMAASTVALKVDLAARLDELTQAGVTVPIDAIVTLSAQVLDPDVTLDRAQAEAAAAIAGTDRLVSVTGPAGAGKTTMLRVAHDALARQGRTLVVVAPTKKAATVAGREIGAAALSLHALLADHGWRWVRDAAGAETWTRLQPGQIDPRSGALFEGPRRFTLRAGDRVLVDEAGMVDLRTANALAAIAAETGAGIAMVGDPLQALPVGHAGAMASLTRRATATVELSTVHRFHDPAYAALTLRLREPANRDTALGVAADLEAGGHVCRVENSVEAREVMVEGYFAAAGPYRSVALVTGTNEEADAINEAIQARRIERGELRPDRTAAGRGDQLLLEGDTVQTRRNDRDAGVENRALWTIRSIGPAGIELVSTTDGLQVRTVSAGYAAEHVQLAYASTVHGIQGETTDVSIVGPGVDAAGLYVGMTRGRISNTAVVVAGSPGRARDLLADSMLRGLPETSIPESIRAARTELSRAAQHPRPAPAEPAGAVPDWGGVDDVSVTTAGLR